MQKCRKKSILFSTGTSPLPASREAQAMKVDRGLDWRERKRGAERETVNVEGRRGDRGEGEVRGEKRVLEMVAIFREGKRERVERTVGVNDAKGIVCVLNTAEISKTALFSFHQFPLTRPSATCSLKFEWENCVFNPASNVLLPLEVKR